MNNRAASHPLALPASFSPDSLDALAELSLVVSQLKPSSGGAGTSNLNNPATSQTQAQAGPQQADSPPTHIAHPLLPEVTNIGDLPLRDVARHSDEIKHKLQRARQQIRLLPDMERTIAEQKDEMAYLRHRMAEQKKVLDMLKNVQLRSSEMDM